MWQISSQDAKPLLQRSACPTSQASVVFLACVPRMCLLLHADHDLQTKGLSGTALYFALARGADGATALDMSKHFDSNYHSLVSRAQRRDRFWPFRRKRERRLTCRLGTVGTMPLNRHSSGAVNGLWAATGLGTAKLASVRTTMRWPLSPHLGTLGFSCLFPSCLNVCPPSHLTVCAPTYLPLC